MELKLMLKSGPHDREESLLPLSIPKKLLGGEFKSIQGGVLALDGKKLPAQVGNRTADALELLVKIPALKKGAETEAVLALSDKALKKGGVSLTTGADSVAVKIGGKLFTRYQFSRKTSKTFLHPVIGPYGGDLARTLKGKHDHPHHRGIFGAHGEVNGVDCWNEPEQHGKIRHKKFLAVEQGPVFARLRVLNWWMRPDDKTRLLEEIRTITFYDLAPQFRTLDHDMELIASFGDVVLGPTKEAGVMGVRMHDDLRGTVSGTIENSYGAVTENECWGRKAQWVDYWGKLNKKTVGLAVFDDPSNPFYPTTWHVRDYGLFAPNPWYWLPGPVTLKRGERIRFNYRVLVHPGNTKAGKVSERFLDFAVPISCKIIS